MPDQVELVWGNAKDDVYAITNGSTHQGGSILLGSYLWHSTGDGTWTDIPSPILSARGVWGTGEDLYVVGNDILHRGSDQKWQSENDSPFYLSLRAVWGSADDDVYAVGASDFENSQILHSNGNGTWTEQSVPGKDLFGVWGSGKSDVLAVGYGIYHSTGDGEWDVQQADGDTTLFFGVWGSGSDDLYVVGSNGVILHSTGDGSWVPQISGTTEVLRAIWGSGAGDIYVVSGDGAILHSTGDGVWTSQLVPMHDGYRSLELNGIWGSESGDVYAVGQWDTGEESNDLTLWRGEILHGSL